MNKRSNYRKSNVYSVIRAFELILCFVYCCKLLTVSCKLFLKLLLSKIVSTIVEFLIILIYKISCHEGFEIEAFICSKNVYDTL